MSETPAWSRENIAALITENARLRSERGTLEDHIAAVGFARETDPAEVIRVIYESLVEREQQILALKAELAALHAAPSKEKAYLKELRFSVTRLIEGVTPRMFEDLPAVLRYIEKALEIEQSADPLASGGWQAEEKHVSMLVDGVMALLDGAYRRGLFAPDYRHLVRADVDRFVRTAFASFQIPIPPLPAEPESDKK